MSELSGRARELVSAGKSALRPSDADRERVLDALQSRLGAPTPTPAPGDAAAPIEAASTKAGWAWVALGLAGAGIMGTLYATSTQPDAPVAAPSATASTTVQALEPPPDELPEPPREPELAPQVVPSATVSPPPSARRAPDRLAEEVAILGRAAAALRAGRAADALAALNEHQSKFPKGALTQERRAARAEALCSLGRFAEARAELARLPKSSPQAVRAGAFCDKRAPK